MPILYVLKRPQTAHRYKVGCTARLSARRKEIPQKSPYKGYTELIAQFDVSDAGCEKKVHAVLAPCRRGRGKEQFSYTDEDEFLRMVGEAVRDYESKKEIVSSVRDCQLEVVGGRVSFHQLPDVVQQCLRERNVAAAEAQKWTLQKKLWEDPLRCVLHQVEVLGDECPLLAWQRVQVPNFDLQRFRRDQPELAERYTTRATQLRMKWGPPA